MRGNRRAKNGATRSIPHEDFIRDASVGCLHHLNNRQTSAKKRSKAGILCGNLRLYTRRNSSMV